MGVFTGTGLTNRSDIIDTVMARIITEVGTPPTGIGATISRDRSTGVVGSDNVEQWITIPSDRMSALKAMPYGMRAHPGAANYLATNTTDQTFTAASDSDARNFDNFDGQPMNRADEDGSGTETDAPFVNGFNIATPYLRHWIITNPEFGSLETHYPAGERTYLYIIVEVDVNIFRLWGFCDVIQLGTWTTTASGLYLFGCNIQKNDNIGSETFSNSNIHMGSVMFNALAPATGGGTPPGGSGGAGVADMNPNWLYQPDRDGVARSWCQSQTNVASDNVETMTSSEFRALGRDHRISPAAYSGVALRTPMYLYSTRWTVAQVAGSQSLADTDTRWQLLAELPDAFFCNIRDLDPGTVFDDGTNRFLVLPTFQKGTVPSNSNYGILIKNAAL
jgi:hypothetical protein